MTSRGAQQLILGAVIVIAVLAAGLTKIADLDFWWHLETGQLILEQHSIPRTDVFSYTAQGREYIDHEWLFQVKQAMVFTAAGPAGIAVVKCVLIALTLIIVAFYAVSRGMDAVTAGGLALLSIAGGITRFIERPELFSTLFAVLTFIVCDSYLRTRDRRLLFALPVICAVWANIHAAVIVGLVIQIRFIASVPQIVAFVASVAASCLNPFTYRVLTVPFELTKIIDSGVLNNEEWRHPTPEKVPFYFVALGLVAISGGQTLLSVRRASGQTRVSVLHQTLVTLFLAYISLKYIRNVALFSVFVPLLITPPRSWRYVIGGIGAVAAAIVLTIYFPFERGFGVASYFPDQMARVVKQRNLQGHMLNSYGFGGYLIWSLYPERQVFVDGRNEVYVPLLERLKAARDDSRAWNALLRDEQIEYALLEYVDDLDRVVTIDASGRKSEAFAPITSTRFPRSRWALVHFDDDGMIFVRRGGANSVAGEYDAIYPEGRGYQKQLVDRGALDRARVIAQLQQKIAEDPSCRRARVLLDELQNR